MIWVRTHPVCDVCVCALWLTLHSHGASASTLDGGRVWSVVLTQLFKRLTEASANQIASCKYPIPFMQHQRSMWLVVVTMTAHQHHASDTPSVKRWRWRPVWMQREPERAHTRMCVCTQITWTWLCTRGKKRYKYCSFSHTTARFVS